MKFITKEKNKIAFDFLDKLKIVIDAQKNFKSAIFIGFNILERKYHICLLVFHKNNHFYDIEELYPYHRKLSIFNYVFFIAADYEILKQDLTGVYYKINSIWN